MLARLLICSMTLACVACAAAPPAEPDEIAIDQSKPLGPCQAGPAHRQESWFIDRARDRDEGFARGTFNALVKVWVTVAHHPAELVTVVIPANQNSAPIPRKDIIAADMESCAAFGV